MIDRWKQRVRRLKREVHALSLACQDPRMPWRARPVAGLVVAHVFSPIDLIPDFIPVLGYLDDLILAPLGIALAIRLIPPAVLADCRSAAALAEGRPTTWWAAAAIVAIWLGLAALGVVLGLRLLERFQLLP